jgi:hypothetical protein
LTSLSVSCSPESLGHDETPRVIRISGFLRSGDIGLPDKAVTVYYNSGTGFQEITSTMTSNDGTGYYSINWDVPPTLNHGFYVVKAVFAGEAPYEPSEAVTTDTEGGGGFFILPEYTFGL